MPYYLLQAGTTIQRMTTSGTLTTLTLPTNVTVDSSRRLRMATLGNQTVLVNSPNENISVDRFGTVRVLCPRPPVAAPILSTAASGTLDGTFKVKETFIVRDEFGNIVAESDFGPESAASATLTDQFLVASNLGISSQSISARREYRTTTGPGSTYFHWIDVEGNTVSSVQDDLSDAALGLVAAPTDLGHPPRFELIVPWKDRLFAKGIDDIDTLYQSGIGKVYAWPVSRRIAIPSKGSDTQGITGFIPRRDELGVGRANALHKLVGLGDGQNFQRVVVTEDVGIWAPDSAVVIKDTGYFLGNPFGVYSWGPGGVKNISDEKVAAWFLTDTYFNRARFDQAIGCHDPILDAYVIFLSALGSTDLDRWIMYHIPSGTWWGPHKTTAFTPTGAVTLKDTNNIEMMAIYASDGKVYKPQSTKTDGASTAIEYNLIANKQAEGEPDIQKIWLQPSIHTKVQGAGTLQIEPYVGAIGASAQTVINHDMTLGRERLRRLGLGRWIRLRFYHNTNAQDVVFYSCEVPYIIAGRR